MRLRFQNSQHHISPPFCDAGNLPHALHFLHLRHDDQGRSQPESEAKISGNSPSLQGVGWSRVQTHLNIQNHHILITYIHIQHTSANVNYISRSLISPNSLLFIASSLSHNTLLKLIFGRLSQRIPIYPIFSGRNKISWYHESPELANLELNLCTPEPATT